MFLLQSVSLCPFPLQSQLSYRGGREGEMKKCHSKGEGVGQGGLGVRSCGAFLPHLA